MMDLGLFSGSKLRTKLDTIEEWYHFLHYQEVPLEKASLVPK